MEIKQGIPVSSGVAIGEAFVLGHEDYRIPERIIENTPEAIATEKQRYLDAIHKASDELKSIEKDTQNMRDISIIFMGHRFIIEDPEIQKEVVNKIEQSLFSAEYAVSHVMFLHRRKLESFRSEYYTRRLSDLEDIENRLIKHLLGDQRLTLETLQDPFIIVARDLTPSETAILPADKAMAFVTDLGGRTSHTAIVARTRGIPAVVGLAAATKLIRGGDTLIVDGQRGEVIINPDQQTLKKYRKIQHQAVLRRQKLKKLVKLPGETIDGYGIILRANIEDPSEVKIAMENGASGIGLYRTEFIYVNNLSPDEESHLQAYKEAIHHLGKKKLVIRTLDFGADKNFNLDEFKNEHNPFLGCRSIRLCLEKTDLFKTQLRAILRASVTGDVDIMFPMISSLEELRQAKAILEEAKQELCERRLAFNENIKVGIMIEIPSAALICDLLAREVDFFSIGTNDLIQYSLAVDRINARVAYLYKPAHPAIFRLIKLVIDVAKENRVKVSMCGEMSAEFPYIVPLIGLGLRDFSLSPGIIPESKEFIRSITMRRALEITNKVLHFKTHEESIDYLTEEIPQLQMRAYN